MAELTQDAKIRLEALGEELRLAVIAKPPQVSKAANRAAQAYNVVHPERQIQVPAE